MEQGLTSLQATQVQSKRQLVSQEQYERLIVNMDLQKEINNTFNYIEMKKEN